MDGPTTRVPWSVRCVDGVCLVFGVFTLCCHAVVWLGGSLWHLLGAFAAVGLLARLVWRRFVPPVPPPASGPPRPQPTRSALALQAALLGLGATGAVVWSGQPVAFWWLAMGVLGAAFVLLIVPERPVAEPAARGRGLEAGLWGLAVLCAGLTLVAHRMDLDDAFYVNLSAAMADNPGAPLLVQDTLHGVIGLPIHLAVYKLHSYEVWNAVLSRLTGLPAIVCFHWVSAALAAALAVLALARLARWLTPGQWLWTVAGTLCVLVAVGEEHRWYGNFAFVRMWQGKGIFLFVFLPLIHAYAIELALRPSRAGWLRLFAAQVAALGCTSSALWAGPASALVAAASVLRPDRRALAVLGMVLLSSAYVVGAGVAMRQVLADTDTGWATQLTPEVERKARERKELARDAPEADLEIAFSLVLGRSHLRTAALVGLLAAWALCPPGLARRYAVVVPLGVGFVLLDPYTSRLVSANVTGPSYWRALWILPVPLLLGLVLTAPLRVGRLPGPVRHAGAVLACAAFAWAVPATGGLSWDNGVELAWPRLKVPEETYRWAALLTERAGPGAVVVAPGEVCAWLATFNDRSYPLLVRPRYLRGYVEHLGGDDLEHRLLMVNFATGMSRHPQAGQLFEEGLDRFGVRAAMLRKSASAPRARAALRRAGFRLDLKGFEYEIWLRDAPRAAGAGAAS
jgi:hypothetical protein